MPVKNQTITQIKPGVYTFTVSPGISQIDIDLWGAGGAAGSAGQSTQVVTGQQQVGTRVSGQRVVGQRVVGQRVVGQRQVGQNQVGFSTQQVLVSAEVPTINVSAGSQSFSSSGSFTLPLGVTNYSISAGGGGGGGGGGHSATTCGDRSGHHGGTGGAGGSFSYSYTSPPTQSNSIDFTVGQGGAGGTGGESGSSGGSTVVLINGTTVGTAAGGGGGTGYPYAGGKVTNGAAGAGGGGGAGGAYGLGASKGADASGSPGGNGSVGISWGASNIPGSPAVYRTETTPVYEPVFEPVYENILENIYQDIIEAVYAPTYATVPGAPGAAGGPGGYAAVSLTVEVGDQIIVVVGDSGRSARGGASTYSTFNYSGGSSGAPIKGGAGGGGGGASFVLLNGNVVAVAAGGGGGGGGGGGDRPEDRLPGLAGLPGTNNGLGAGIPGLGQNSAAGVATGGAGGGGYWAGSAGTSGKSGTGGSGGTNYGKAVDSGTSTAPGGLTLDSYPKQNPGYAGNPGAAVISIYKSFSLAIKNSNQWKRADRAWVKISGQWREIYNGWTKVNGVWKEIAYSSGPVAAQPTYQLTADRAAVNEGSTVEFRLTTTGVPAGTQIAYSATGIAASDLTSGTLSGSFIAGLRETTSFGIRANQTTNGPRTLTVVLDGSRATGSCIVNDTSRTPTYGVTPGTISVNEGSSLTFNVSGSDITDGTYYWTITNAGDFGTRSGAVIITNNTGSFSVTPTTDSTTEGAETFTASLRSGSTSGPVLATSATVTILDTSVTPVPPPPVPPPPEPPPPPPPAAAYQLSNSVASVNEGGVVMFTLVTQNVSDGTQVPYTISGAGITSDDFDSMQVNGSSISTALTGNFIIQNGVSTLRVVVANDLLIENSETFTVALDNGLSSVSVSIVNTTRSEPQSLTFSYSPNVQTWTVPVGVTSVNVNLTGGGGGGGGSDSSGRGYPGAAGDRVAGTLSVAPGDTLTIYVGGGGAGGLSAQRGTGAGAGGGVGIFAGGTGGNAGGSGSSGSGGGGGGASAIAKNGSPLIVAAGGGGGGGAGNDHNAYATQGGSTSGTAGGAGANKSGDGGGGGGGGGGSPGGAGGGLQGGDYGGYSGNNGTSIGGTVTSRGGAAGGSNGIGQITVFDAATQSNVTRQTYPEWGALMNANAVWETNIGAASCSRTYTIDAPVTGTYNLQVLVDNTCTIYIDGVAVLSAANTWTATSFTQKAISLSAGSHTLRWDATNTGHPGGIAVRLVLASASGAGSGASGNVVLTWVGPVPR